jgi:hypothetical protein
MQTKYKAQNTEQLARDKRFEVFEEALGLRPTKCVPKKQCQGHRDHLHYYKSGANEVQFDAPYAKNELPEDYHSVWLPPEIDPYQGGVAVGTGPTYPRLSCHKSSKANLEWLAELAADWAASGDCYEGVS